ncbi:MAG TPA: Hsp70 family protein [Polyangiaceae bacterium]
MSEARYAIGIDLGTTHTALAVSELAAPAAELRVFEVPQLVTRGALEARPLLPSFLYFAHESEGKLTLPWGTSDTAVGEFARARATESPGRTVSSAKSWLSHAGANRREALLPLNAPEDVEKISPVEASFRYLDHLAEAFRHAAAVEIASEDVILAVPASFDAAARELTVEAAEAAGFERVTLLEEPQAALYAWLAARGEAFRSELRPGDVVLVIDIGGGTSDFSAIAVTEREGNLELQRAAVGDHILLGGDNMDLALAHVVKKKLADAGTELDAWQFTSLTHACRAAKEKLLSAAAPDGVPVVIPSRGAQLLGGAVRTELTRSEVESTLVEGFFPSVEATARPAVRPRAGLTQLGLPYAFDPAITKHLAAFLTRQSAALAALPGFPQAPAATLLRPTALLFNGGVLKAATIQRRIVSTLNAWLERDGAPALRVLSGADPDLGVARGAAYYGRVRRGQGLRIRGGTARAYYVGIESPMPAVPGVEPPITALCVAPFGMEEGTEAELPPQELAVVVGEPVQFRFFGSSVRRNDAAGALLESWKAGELEELAPIALTLPAEGRPEGDVVPIRLHPAITPVGTLLLEAVPVTPLHAGERWKVELGVRGDAGR